MGTLIISLLAVSIIGHQVDANKIKKYEMIDGNGKAVKVQFSKKGEYSCPMSCDLNHFHYAKKTDHNIDNVWSVQSISDNIDKKKFRFNVNGSDIVSYQLINVKQKPKRLPKIPTVNQNLIVAGK